MSTKEQILTQMPDEFSRSEWLSTFSSTGYSYSYANKLLEESVLDGSLERLDRGQYRKTELQEA